MATQGKNSKRPRKPKTSKGIHGGGGKAQLDAVQLVLLGKGMAHGRNFSSKSKTLVAPKMRPKRRPQIWPGMSVLD